MNNEISPDLTRLRLGRILRDLRAETGLTLAEVGEQVDSSEATLSRIERGDTPSHPAMVRTMLEVYAVPRDDWDAILDLARQAKPSTSEQRRALDNGYQALQAQAISVRAWELTLVPSLLRTTEYTRVVHAQDKDLTRLLAQHAIEQRRLTVARVVRVHAIIDESVLCRPIGGKRVLADQLLRLIQLAAEPNVKIQVLPMRIGMSVGLSGSFRLLAFPADTIDDIVYVDHAAGGERVIKKENITKLTTRFHDISQLALSPTESVALITQYANRHDQATG